MEADTAMGGAGDAEDAGAIVGTNAGREELAAAVVGDNNDAAGLQPLVPTSFADLLADFFQQHAPGRVAEAPALAAAHAGKQAELQAALEAQYRAPRHFATIAFNFRSRFFDPAACLYDPYVAPPVPGIRPLDNLSKAAVLLPASNPDSRAYVRLGILHDAETERRDAARWQARGRPAAAAGAGGAAADAALPPPGAGTSTGAASGGGGSSGQWRRGP